MNSVQTTNQKRNKTKNPNNKIWWFFFFGKLDDEFENKFYSDILKRNNQNPKWRLVYFFSFSIWKIDSNTILKKRLNDSVVDFRYQITQTMKSKNPKNKWKKRRGKYSNRWIFQIGWFPQKIRSQNCSTYCYFNKHATWNLNMPKNGYVLRKPHIRGAEKLLDDTSVWHLFRLLYDHTMIKAEQISKHRETTRNGLFPIGRN